MTAKAEMSLFFVVCSAVIWFQAEAGNHCCGPAQYSAHGVSIGHFYQYGVTLTRNILRHYDGQAKLFASSLLKGAHEETKEVWIHDKLFLGLQDKCYVYNFTFRPDCVSDTYDEQTPNDGSGSGSGSGDGDSLTSYRKTRFNPYLSKWEVVILKVNSDCLVKEKHVYVISKAHKLVYSFHYFYHYDTVGSLGRGDPKCLFAHCHK